MTLQEKQLERQSNRLAFVKSAECRPVVIRPNTEVTVQGYLDKALPYPVICALTSPTRTSTVTDDVDIVPSIIPYNYLDKEFVQIHLSNVSTRTVIVQSKSILCELQLVDIEDVTEIANTTDNGPLSKVKLCTDNLTETEVNQAQELLSKHAHIFSKGVTDIGHITQVKHRIYLFDDESFKQRTRRIPPPVINEVRDHLHQLLAAGIIKHSHSPWSSNVLLARKKDDSLECVWIITS